MAVTLTEAEKYTTNSVKRGVLEEIIKDSIVMQKLPFMDVVGNAYQYLREKTLPDSNFYDPNDVWTEDTGDVYQKTAVIKIMGGDADVDNFLKATRADKTDFAAETIQKKAKAVKHAFLNTFWYGDNSATSKEFDGVHTLILTGGESDAELTAQSTHEGSAATPSALNASNIDATIDKILDGKPDCMVMSRKVRRLFKTYLRGKSNVELTMEEYGRAVRSWDGIPIEYDDFLVDTETIASSKYSAKTGGASSSVFFLRFGTDDLCGLQSGGLETLKLGQLESKDAQRWRIRWYVGLALFRTIGIAIIDGIDASTALVD